MRMQNGGDSVTTYTIKAHPTLYHGTMFRSRLEARWAAFFDLAGWAYEYEAFDLVGWTPDFLVHFKCGHSECPEGHRLFAEVKPYRELSEFDGHHSKRIDPYSQPSPARLGYNPFVSEWEMVHGSGGGIYSVADCVPGAMEHWDEAGNITRWMPA